MTSKGLYLGHLIIGRDKMGVLVTTTDGNVMMTWDDWIKTPDGQLWSSRNAVTKEDVEDAASYDFRSVASSRDQK